MISRAYSLPRSPSALYLLEYWLIYYLDVLQLHWARCELAVGRTLTIYNNYAILYPLKQPCHPITTRFSPELHTLLRPVRAHPLVTLSDWTIPGPHPECRRRRQQNIKSKFCKIGQAASFVSA